MKKSIYILLLVIAPIAVFAQPLLTKAYIQQYKDIAIKEMKRTGIPASITLAQAIVESSSGESNLAKKFNNHFGIKCKLDWKGETTFQDDDSKNECFRVYKDAASSFKDHSDFLKNRPNYASLFELDPVDDTAWAYGLKKAGYATSSEYPKKLLKVIDDYELSQYNYPELVNEPEEVEKAATLIDTVIKKDTTQAPTPILVKKETVDEKAIVVKSDETIQLNTIKGITTNTNSNNSIPSMKGLGAISKDPTSSKSIISIKKDTTINAIKDSIVKQKESPYPFNKRLKINDVPVIWAQAGNSFLAIANQYHVPLYKIYQYNDLQEMDLVEKDQLVFLGEKKKESNKKVHIIKAGETLYNISQTEGIQFGLLQSYNPTATDHTLLEGTILYLFSMPKDKMPVVPVAPAPKTTPTPVPTNAPTPIKKVTKSTSSSLFSLPLFKKKK